MHKARRFCQTTLGLSLLLLLLLAAPVLAGPTDWAEQGVIYSAPAGDAYYPSVLYDAAGFGGGAVYRMWYSDGSGSVWLTTSADGVTWGAPTAGTGAGTDVHHVQVLYDANCFGTLPCDASARHYRIWYWDTDLLYTISAIATADSVDGIVWTNDQAITQDPANQLVTGAGVGWNRGTYGPISLIYQPGASNTGTEPWEYSYVMYYDGMDGSSEFTGLAYSTDGLYWTAYTGNPVLAGSVTPAWDCSDSAYGTVLKDGSTYHYWYSGGGGNNGGACLQSPVHQGIGYASSADGKTWTKDGGNPIFHITDGVVWRSARTYTPSVLYGHNGQLRMYYTVVGGDGVKRIALALTMPDDVWVDDSWGATPPGAIVYFPGDPNPHVFWFDAFGTIQDGVTAVAAGGTVHVAAGTYTPPGNISITKSMTILGPQADVDPRPYSGSTRTAGSADEAVVDGLYAALSNVFNINADYVTINGLEVKSGASDQINQANARTGTVVKYNLIHDGRGDEGIQLRGCAACVIEYNYIYDIKYGGDGICVSNGSSNCSIRHNELYDIGTENAAIYIYDSTNVEVLCNTIHHVTEDDAITMGNKGGQDAAKSGGPIRLNQIWDVEEDGITVYMSNVLVEGNDISNSRSENGAIYLAYAISNVSIKGNSVHDSTLKTTKFADAAAVLLNSTVNAGTVTVSGNNLYNVTPFGVTNKHPSQWLNATNNWWGDASGPFDPTGTTETPPCNDDPSQDQNVDGFGLYVFGSVDYCPWAAAPFTLGVNALTVDKADRSDPVIAGQNIIYDIVVTNHGTTDLPQVWVNDTLPSGLGVVSITPVAFFDGVQTVNWNLGTMTAGQIVTLTVEVTTSLTTSGLVTNTVEGGYECAWDQDVETTQVLQQDLLAVSKTSSADPVCATYNFNYYIYVTNTSPIALHNVVVKDLLPPEVAPYAVAPGAGGVFDGVNTVVWNVASLGPGNSLVLPIKARTYSTAVGKCMTNQVGAASDETSEPVYATYTVCVTDCGITRPTPVPTPTPTPAPAGTTVVIKRGGPGTSWDTYIYRNQPYSNYWLEPLLKVGYKQTNASLIQFDLSPIPAGARIDEAWLEVWAAGWSGPFSDMTVGAYAISETVQISQTTWVSPELGSLWTLAGANDVLLDRRAVPESTVTTSGPLKWYRFDVATLVQEWLDGGTANNGVMLRCESCTGRKIIGLGPMPGNLCPYTYFFASSENAEPAVWPRLVVRYE